MKKSVWLIAGSVVVVCGGGFFAWSSFQRQAAAAGEKKVPTVEVKSDNIRVVVVENGTIDSVKSVELKSQVTGRLSKLFVEEGDLVTKGQLIAVIDPQETELRVKQDAAQLRGAQSSADRTLIEIEQRRRTAEANVEQARTRVKMLELDVKTQPTVLQAAVNEAQTSLEIAEAEKRRLLESTQLTEKAQVAAQVAEAQANLANAELELKRQEELLAKGYVAQRAVDTARLNVSLAKTRLLNAEEAQRRQPARFAADLESANERIVSAQATLARAKANFVQAPMKQQELISARADLQKAIVALKDADVLVKTREQNLATIEQLSSALDNSRRNLSETEIRSPIDGIVTKKGIQVGELATGLSSFGSGTTIVKIEDRNAMRVKLNMNEIDTAKLRLGMDATIDVDALPANSYSGKVTKIAPASTETQGAASADAVVRYQVEILLNNPDRSLRTGMSAKCSMAVIDRPNVLTVPVDFVKKDGKKTYAYLAVESKDPKAEPQRVEIKLGGQSGAKVEVLDGLKAGQKIQKPKYDGPDRKSFIQFGGGDD